ncbi:MAG: hypothetical protein RBU37_03275 [Myxococcota bacterium]|jgi:hypothetical protein|nr:hypothetical protein [Myxococcota bacterium]
MGALEGSLSYRQYFVDGELNDHDALLERIRHHSFSSLNLEDEEPKWGWVCAANPLDVDFRRDNVFFNQYVVLALRQDRWRLPAALLKARVNDARLKLMASSGKERLARHERDAIMEEQKRQLKEKSLPAMSVVDMAWDTAGKSVRFWTHNNAMNELFQELFEETFQLHLVPLSPYTMAANGLLEDEALEALFELDPDDLSKVVFDNADAPG